MIWESTASRSWDDTASVEEGQGDYANRFYMCNTCHGCAVPVTREDMRRLRDALNKLDLDDSPLDQPPPRDS